MFIRVLNRALNGRAAQRAAAFLVSFYLRFALASTRWTLDGEAHVAAFVPDGKVIVAFWHECLPLMPAMWLRVLQQNPGRRARVLVSRHRDGRFIGTILAHFRLGTVHGSASRVAGKQAKERGGAAALRGLLAALEASDAAVMTPDGPRGPARQAAPGVAQLAMLGHAPVLPMAARVRHLIRLNSWDRMMVPLPWGRGVLVCLPPIQVADDGGDAVANIAAALTAAADRAEALCA